MNLKTSLKWSICPIIWSTLFWPLNKTFRLIPTCNSWLFWKVQKWLEYFQCSNLIFCPLNVLFHWNAARGLGDGKETMGFFLEMSMLILKCPNGKHTPKRLKKYPSIESSTICQCLSKHVTCLNLSPWELVVGLRLLNVAKMGRSSRRECL